jgi:hypothetical protein
MPGSSEQFASVSISPLDVPTSGRIQGKTKSRSTWFSPVAALQSFMLRYYNCTICENDYFSVFKYFLYLLHIYYTLSFLDSVGLVTPICM